MWIELCKLNRNYQKLGGLNFEHQSLSGVTENYNAANVLNFGGQQLYPDVFSNSTFLVALNGSATLGKASLYLVVFGASGTKPAIVRLDATTDSTYPKLDTTASYRVYAVWSASATAVVHASVFRLY